jgi:hypothetical protein
VQQSTGSGSSWRSADGLYCREFHTGTRVTSAVSVTGPVNTIWAQLQLSIVNYRDVFSQLGRSLGG